MTLSEALKKLKPPLKFGDAEQIVAVDFVALVASCVQAIDECNHVPHICAECKGTGRIHCVCECGDEHMADCESCDGDGTGVPGCEQCLTGFGQQVRYEALVVHQQGWPRFWWKD